MLLARWVITWMAVTATNGTTEQTCPAGDWERLPPGATKGRGWLEVAARYGNPSIGVGIQVCNDPTTVDASTRCSTLSTANGVTNPSGNPTTLDLDGEIYIRPCVFIKAGTDGTISGGMVSGVVELWV